MSSGLECVFVEVEPGKWYYLLQDGDCPAQVRDWREYATAYGPFKTHEQALRHLYANHANPGGWMVMLHESLVEQGILEKWATLVQGARV